MAQKITNVGELREALSECADDMPICTASDMGELEELFIYSHERKQEIGFAFETETVIVFESDSPHYEFNLE